MTNVKRQQFIYGLCTAHGQIAYVGKSADPRRRYREHMKIDHGFLVAGIAILEAIVDDADSSVAERKWISFFGRENLFNKTNGGNGAWAYPVSEHTRSKIARNSLGNSYARGYRHTEEAKRKISEASVGNKHSAGRTHTIDYKEMMRERMKGNTHSVGRNVGNSFASGNRFVRSPFTAEHRDKLRRAKAGNKNRLGGKKFLERSMNNE